MSEKSTIKKNQILEVARDLFAEKGYFEVTIKDVVEALNISRGGIYIYFNNIRDLFEGVMQYEIDTEEDFTEKIKDDATYADVLALFVKEQKKSILTRKPNLAVAMYEYYFANKVSPKNNILKNQFDTSLYVLNKIIAEGIEAGEFYDIDAHRAASNLMYVIEGLKVSSRTRGITEAVVDEEIMYVMQGIIAEE